MRRPSQQQACQEQEKKLQPNHEEPTDYFDLNVLKGAVSFNTKPFKHRALVWIGFKKVLFFPLCWNWWLARDTKNRKKYVGALLCLVVPNSFLMTTTSLGALQIPRVQFFLGSTLYALHHTCTWLYIRGCLPLPPSRSLPPSWGGASAEDNHVTHVEILLPYVIGCLFGIGYGSVVAAGGWEALRVPSRRSRTGSSKGRSGRGSYGAGTDGGSSRKSGGTSDDDISDVASSASSGVLKRDLSFAAQVCAWDSRADEQARAAAADDDDDDDFDSSGLGSENDDVSEIEDRNSGDDGGREKKVVIAPSDSTGAAASTSVSDHGQESTASPTLPHRLTRSTIFGFHQVVGGSDGDGDGIVVTAGSDSATDSEPRHDAPSVRPPGNPATENRQTSVGESNVKADDDVTDADIGPGGGRKHLRRMSLVHHQSSYDSGELDEEDDEEEEDSGWGQQVVIKPVKVSRWDKGGSQRTKALLSLSQLRACIIERAESTPQRATYRRAARLGVCATILLPTIFTLCAMVTSAWFDAASPAATETIPTDLHEDHQASAREGCAQDGEGEAGVCSATDVYGEDFGGVFIEEKEEAACGHLKLEELAFAAMWRAAEALWALVSRVMNPEAGDYAAAAVSTISLCSVAFFAAPAFRALEDAERTYQRRYMYSKYFCALTSSQRARKHRLPYFSLKNVANIRVWLALRAGKTWLRRHRRERRADAVVSSAFFLSLALLAAILSEAISGDIRFLSTVVHWELLVWCCFVSFFLLRYLTLGSNTNNRYRDTSVLLTEQINVQLRILQNTSNREASKKAIKRERLGVSTNVLKLATKLLKELDGPNKLSGLSMNPMLYNITRVVLVSALSGVMSDTLGFSVKLWKVLSFK